MWGAPVVASARLGDDPGRGAEQHDRLPEERVGRRMVSSQRGASSLEGSRGLLERCCLNAGRLQKTVVNPYCCISYLASSYETSRPPAKPPASSQRPPRRHTKMAVQNNCAHAFRMIKSDNTLVQWMCNLCHSGPHWWIFECRYCKIHTCRACVNSAYS